jgi:catechol-2,3-dioxygenase
MARPARLAHAVLKTFDVDRMTQWYMDALDARLVFGKPGALTFITYDDEHHRMGFLALPGDKLTSDPRAAGLAHLAFTFDNIRDLLGQYEKLRDLGRKPAFSVNHGPTLSFYYQDPDGNGVELMVDRFATAEEAQDFIDRYFDANPIGVDCDPEDLLARMRAGASDEELLFYDDRMPPAIPEFQPMKIDEVLAPATVD